MTGRPYSHSQRPTREASPKMLGRPVRSAFIPVDPDPDFSGMVSGVGNATNARYFATGFDTTTEVLQVTVTTSDVNAFVYLWVHAQGECAAWARSPTNITPGWSWDMIPTGAFDLTGHMITSLVAPRNKPPAPAQAGGTFVIGGFTGSQSFKLRVTSTTFSWNMKAGDVLLSWAYFGQVNVSVLELLTVNRQIYGRSGLTSTNNTGVARDFVVPTGVSSLLVELRGGGRGVNATVDTGFAAGAIVAGTLGVTPGETLRIYAGHSGSLSSNVGTPIVEGWPDGGPRGPNSGVGSSPGGGGAGSSQIRKNPFTIADRVVIAGGAGGERGGGAGGHPSGATGPNGSGGFAAVGGTGGSQTAGGIGGASGGGEPIGGTDGTQAIGGTGGRGSGSTAGNGGGGGGGGYWGGGGGGGSIQSVPFGAASGGGGSSYVGGLSSVTTNSTGGNGPDGLVTLTW